MIQLINNDYQDTVAIKIAGEVTSEDYDRILPVIEDKMGKADKIKFYCELEDFEDIEPGAIWKDLKFDIKHYNDVDKLAVIGDKQWVDWMSKFARPFTSAEVQQFDSNNKEEAWNWLLQEKERN